MRNERTKDRGKVGALPRSRSAALYDASGAHRSCRTTTRLAGSDEALVCEHSWVSSTCFRTTGLGFRSSCAWARRSSRCFPRRVMSKLLLRMVESGIWLFERRPTRTSDWPRRNCKHAVSRFSFKTTRFRTRSTFLIPMVSSRSPPTTFRTMSRSSRGILNIINWDCWDYMKHFVPARRFELAPLENDSRAWKWKTNAA